VRPAAKAASLGDWRAIANRILKSNLLEPTGIVVLLTDKPFGAAIESTLAGRFLLEKPVHADLAVQIRDVVQTWLPVLRDVAANGLLLYLRTFRMGDASCSGFARDFPLRNLSVFTQLPRQHFQIRLSAANKQIREFIRVDR
jgi:hypothetical protein